MSYSISQNYIYAGKLEESKAAFKEAESLLPKENLSLGLSILFKTAKGLISFLDNNEREYRSSFKKAEAELTQDLRKPLVIARIMGAIYRRILDRITQLNQFNTRIELKTWEKMQIARQVFAEAYKK